MENFFTSPSGFFIIIALFILGAISSLVFQASDRFANRVGNALAILGSSFGLIFSTLVLLKGSELSFVAGTSIFPLVSFSFHIDALSAFFIFTISLIALLCSVYALGYLEHYYRKYNIGMLGFFYNTLILSLILIVSASNALFFLVVWEIMAIASYFIVVYDRNDHDNVKAGLLYFTMTYVGTALILFAFLLLYKYVGSFDFEKIREGISLVPSAVKDFIFMLMLIGFGTKAGIIPFHIWLPTAHSATPAHVSALMSGVIIKVGIYMMIRTFLDILQPAPAWWGFLIVILGSISALLGVLYAITEHDIKKLLAYHSIENIGIILLGLGSALVFFSLSMPSLALIGLIAALFHSLNHAVFKSLLFFSAGAVVNETHTRNIEEHGGLIKYMPHTAFFFLIGAMAITALPPFNGFFSEWLTFQTLFQGIMTLDSGTKWVFIAGAGALAFSGGLALFCFVKVFGAVFLARPRSKEVQHAKESARLLQIAMSVLALLSIAVGIGAGYVVSFFEKIGNSFGVLKYAPEITQMTSGQTLVAPHGFATVSAPLLVLFFIFAFLVIVLFLKLIKSKEQRVVIGTTWDCGMDLTPRMEITSTGFARSIILIFKGLLKPSFQNEVKYNDAMSRYLPKSRTITLGVRDVYQVYFYHPIEAVVDRVSLHLKNIQSGNINTYIMYIFLSLIIALYLVL